MIRLRLPSEEAIRLLHDQLASASPTYPEVGASFGPDLPSGFAIDRNAVLLGTGGEVFHRARQALQDGVAFQLPWVRAHPSGPLAVGTQIAVVARVVGLWWLNFSRVVQVVDETHRFAFAYGTLPVHAETGEERFQVEHDPVSDEVRYEILAFSRPRHLLARLGGPWARATQRRFAQGSLEAVRRSVLGDQSVQQPLQR